MSAKIIHFLSISKNVLKKSTPFSYFLKTSIIKHRSTLSQQNSDKFSQNSTNSLKNIALILLFFRCEQLLEVRTVKSQQFESIPDISRGKINSCETLNTTRERISR